MRRIPIFSGFVVLALACFPAAAQPSCVEVGIVANAEVGDSGVTLADLLTARSCPALRRAAAAVWLGNAPQPGSTRIFEGAEIRRALVQIQPSGPLLELHLPGFADARIPERIVVRRAGPKASCNEIMDSVSRALGTRDSAMPRLLPPLALDCGSTRIPQGAGLELTRVFWDPALRGWEYSLRCVRASDCVPFLVRQSVRQSVPQGVQQSADSGHAGAASFSPLDSSPFDSHARPGGPPTTSLPLAVQVGQTATLFWEQDGIRAVLPVTCLDRGPVGGLVRARAKNGNHIFRAEVVSPGVLRAAL
jgi:hypothetical protein